MTMALSTSLRNRAAASAVAGDDAVGVVRSVARYVLHGFINAADGSGGDDAVEELVAPVGRGGRDGCFGHGRNCFVGAYLATLFTQGSNDGGGMGFHDVAMDQQAFGGPAHAGAAHLGVDDDAHSHVEVSGLVDIDVADAFKMREHRHARFGLDAAHQRLAAARHDQVNGAAKPCQHHADCRAVCGWHHLDGGFRQACLAQSVLQAADDERRTFLAVRTAAQDGGIAGLHGECTGIGGHVGAAFVDDADHPDGHAHPGQVEPVGPLPVGHRLANGIRQGSDVFEPLCHGLNAIRRQCQPVDE
jgi:hypothetical protein